MQILTEIGGNAGRGDGALTKLFVKTMIGVEHLKSIALAPLLCKFAGHEQDIPL